MKGGFLLGSFKVGSVPGMINKEVLTQFIYINLHTLGSLISVPPPPPAYFFSKHFLTPSLLLGPSHLPLIKFSTL